MFILKNIMEFVERVNKTFEENLDTYTAQEDGFYTRLVMIGYKKVIIHESVKGEIDVTGYEYRMEIPGIEIYSEVKYSETDGVDDIAKQSADLSFYDYNISYEQLENLGLTLEGIVYFLSEFKKMTYFDMVKCTNRDNSISFHV